MSTLKGLDMLSSSATDHVNALRILHRFRGAKLTYVDASSLAIIEKRKIATVWSTDHHLRLTCADILTRS